MREECIANCSGDSVKNKHHWVWVAMMGDNICDNTGLSVAPGGHGQWLSAPCVGLHCIALSVSHCHYSHIGMLSWLLTLVLSSLLFFLSTGYNHCRHYLNMRTRKLSWLRDGMVLICGRGIKCGFLRQFSPHQGRSQTTLDIPTCSQVRSNL